MFETDGLTRVRIVAATGAVAWAVGLQVWLPRSIAAALPVRNDGVMLDGDLRVDPAVAAAMREWRAFTDRRPLSARSPLSYRRVPSYIRDVVAAGTGLLGRFHPALRRYPAWPLDLSADLLADLARISNPFRQGPTPVLLTHDIDSPEGLKNLHAQFLPLEEAYGARSTNYVVPHEWPLDHVILEDVVARGHDLGIHGYDHSHVTPFAAPQERRTRIAAAADLVARYTMTGYRAPSLVRTRALLADLSALYAYDSSIPTSGGLFPIPGTGCGTARPFRIEEIEEIPLSLPRDGSLRYLGYRPDAIAALWIDCAARIARSGGVVVLLTHCEARWSGNRPMLAAYRRFLEHVAATPSLRWAMPGELLTRAAA